MSEDALQAQVDQALDEVLYSAMMDEMAAEQAKMQPGR